MLKLSSIFFFFPFFSVFSKDLALVYNGPGACEEDCAKAAAEMAKKAGLKPKYVNPNDIDPALFKDVKLWIQPGGMSATVGKTINPKLRANLVDFIKNGGAYVGFCAGGFFTAQPDEERDNLKIFDGKAIWHRGFPDIDLVTEVTWNNKKRAVYWEGGPYFEIPKGSEYEPTSYYHDGKVAGIRGTYGKGRVNVVGFHPEAPQWWFDDIKKVPEHPGILKKDTDGLDHDISIEMINWALKK